MGICSGCSKSFPKLSAERCQKCVRLTPRHHSKWISCNSCGDVYEFMEGNTCDTCISDVPEPPKTTTTGGEEATAPVPSLQDAVRYAYHHTVNPRTFSRPDGRHEAYSNPYLSDNNNGSRTLNSDADWQKRKDNELIKKAGMTVQTMNGSYQTALVRNSENQSSRSNSRTMSKPKLLGPSASAFASASYNNSKASAKSNPLPIIVMLSKVENRYTKKKVQSFTRTMDTYPEDTPWSQVVENIRDFLDSVYIQEFETRIYSSEQFTLVYTSRNTKLNNDHTKDTLKRLWNYSLRMGSGVVITKTAEAKRILDISAIVDHPSPEVQNSWSGSSTQLTTFGTYLESPVRSHSSKRKLSTILDVDEERSHNIHRPKRPTLLEPSGASAYKTSIDSGINEILYYVAKLELSEDDTWMESSDHFKASVEVKEFDSGLTKEVFKMRLNGKRYAAKRFYNIGDKSVLNAIPYADNLRHLKEEAVRQNWALHCVEKFQKTCIKEGISIFDLHVEQPRILKVVEGPEKGLAWIFDPLIENSKTRKFSGTSEAGSNHDLVGRTCDALAHFSLYDSNDSVILVDIQGIIHSRSTGTGNVLTLFDVMFHTVEKDAGLGDLGVKGIKKFISQHKCNLICKKLGLQPADQKEDDDDHGPSTKQKGKGKQLSSSSSQDESDGEIQPEVEVVDDDLNLGLDHYGSSSNGSTSDASETN